MKQIIKRGRFLTLMFMLLCCSSLYAADDDLITKQITITLDEADNLPKTITSRKKYKITNLKIVGEINGTDLLMIRDMAGSDYRGNKTYGNLSVLDLSEAKVVSGGDFYCYDESYKDNVFMYNCKTSNDEIGRLAFYNCSNLTSLTLPSSIISIGSRAFIGCTKLTSLALFSNLSQFDYIDTDGIRESLKETT